jgi:hypothetical protein
MDGVSRPARCCRHQRLWLVALVASFALVSCGNSTFTIVGTSNGLKTYLVISGNADDVAKLKDDYASHATIGQIVDGDQHSGDLICEHDSAKNGHHLHFALYGSTITTEQCQLVFAEFP